MRLENVPFFTDKEAEFVNLLVALGLSKNAAKVLVFLENTSEATSREIERETDSRQLEVSIAIKYLIEQGWVDTRDIPSEKKWRPRNIYKLAIPSEKIIAAIEKRKKDKLNNELARVNKLKEYLK